MSYRINIVPTDNTPSFKYTAISHPAIGELVYYRDKRFKVDSVGHIIGSCFHIAGETNALEYVEVTVIPF